MKIRNLLVALMCLTALSANAQKIDGRLTNLIKKTAVPARMSRAGVRNTEAMQAFQKAAKETYSVEFNADGSVRSIGVLAYLKEGTECPTELLKQMGITVNSTFDNVAFLSVPADRLAELETVDDITLVVPEGKVRVMNMDARKATKADKAGSTADAVAEGLPQAYTGSGVVLGIIDIGARLLPLRCTARMLPYITCWDRRCQRIPPDWLSTRDVNT